MNVSFGSVYFVPKYNYSDPNAMKDKTLEDVPYMKEHHRQYNVQYGKNAQQYLDNFCGNTIKYSHNTMHGTMVSVEDKDDKKFEKSCKACGINVYKEVVPQEG